MRSIRATGPLFEIKGNVLNIFADEVHRALDLLITRMCTVLTRELTEGICQPPRLLLVRYGVFNHALDVI